MAGTCSQCGAPRPAGCTVTCGTSECQEAEHRANSERVKRRIVARRGKSKPAPSAHGRGRVYYRVVDDGDTVRIQGVAVAAVHINGDIVLERRFVGMSGVKFKGSSLGTHFWPSEQDALNGYMDRMRAQIATAERAVKSAEAAISWARHMQSKLAHGE